MGRKDRGREASLDLFQAAEAEAAALGSRGPGQTSGAEPGAGARAEPEALSVSELNRRIRSVLEGSFGPLVVRGEVANWKRARSGHCYFSLKDEKAQIRCVMWRTEAARLPMDPDEGMEVRVEAALTVYEVRGEYQLRVQRLDAAGEEGLWRLAFERLRTRLDEEGLLAAERKRPIPRFPATVGVVTSTSGAALRDILSVLRRRAPWTQVLVWNARVQGEGAAAEIAAAIEGLAATGRIDVMIVGRGGGSVEDLWAFNEEPVVRAVAACPVPVVSAVGHEVDVTLSDLVADLRAPTPSAGAEAVVQDGETLRRQMVQVQLRLRRALHAGVDRRRRRLEDGPRRLVRALQARTGPTGQRIREARRRLAREIQDLLAHGRRRVQVEDRLLRAVQTRVGSRRRDLAGLAGRLSALSPLATLERGYAIPQADDGRLLRRAGDFPPGGQFRLRVVDGRVVCIVDHIVVEDEA